MSTADKGLSKDLLVGMILLVGMDFLAGLNDTVVRDVSLTE